MNSINREQLKKLFKKVKKLRLPADLEDIDFSYLYYYSWLDQSDMTLFTVYEYNGIVTGIRFDVVQPPAGALRLGFCEFCYKHRRQSGVFFISRETRTRPKGVNYRSRGTWICSDYAVCNRAMQTDSRIQEFYTRILE